MESTHVVKLKQHRNILYGIVVVLLVLQILSFAFVSFRMANVQAQQDQVNTKVLESLTDIKQDNQYKFNAIASEISAQKSSFDQQITLLKSSQSDFSGVIDTVIKSVVSIATDKSSGTGFIIDSSGYVVTNQHVVDNTQFVKVITYDGKTYDAQLVGQDAFNDVVLLKIGGTVFPKLEFANSDDVQIGEKVIAIGNPLGLSFTVTEGIVSALHRKGPNGQSNYIQTDVTLNPGNSGGPLINKEGKVIGMNNFKLGQAEGLGFALESNIVKKTEETLYASVKQ